MAYKTFVAGEEALASDVNTYLMNQTVAQFSSVANRDSLWAAPPNGAVCVTTDKNRIWQRIAGAWRLTGGSMPKFQVVGGGAGQVVNSGTDTVFNWANGTKAYDTDNLITIPGGVLTVPSDMAGDWQFDWTAHFDSYSGGIRFVWLTVITIRSGLQVFPLAVAPELYMSGSVVRPLAAGDTVGVAGNQTSGIALGCNKTVYSKFSGRYLGP